MSFLHHLMAKQARLPKGFLGKLAGGGMSRQNRRLIEWSLELLDIQPADRVLDIGFGPGYSIQTAAQMASQGWVAGLELSEAMLKEASKLNAASIAAGRVELRHGDASSLPYGDDEFDKALAVNVLYFWEDPMAPLAETRRVIRAGGRIVLAVVDKEDLKKQKITQTGVFRLYSGEEAAQLLTDAGFSRARFDARAVHEAGMGICAIAER